MLLPLFHTPDMLIYPTIRILTYITRCGHQVTWVISSRRAGQLQRYSINDAEVYALPYGHYLPGDSVLARGFNKLFHTYKKMRFVVKTFREGKHNLILARNDPFDGLIAMYIKRKYKVPFIFELSNSLEHEWECLKINRRKPAFLYYLIAKSKRLLRIYLARHADLVLPISKWLKERHSRNGTV